MGIKISITVYDKDLHIVNLYVNLIMDASTCAHEKSKHEDLGFLTDCDFKMRQHS